MKNYYLLLITILLFTNNALDAQTKTYLSNAVNIAGKQRMLGQRMAKDRVFMAANKNKIAASKELENTIINFEKSLKILEDFAPNETIKHKVTVQSYVFNKYKKAVNSRSLASLNDVIETNTMFLTVCDDVVNELINYSKTLKSEGGNSHQKYVIDKIAEATGASGKLRYLTQRLTLYYSLNEFGFKKITPLEIEDISKKIDLNLGYLSVLEFNTLEIDDSLSEVQYYWNQLKGFIYKDGKIDLTSKKINAVAMYNLCNTILGKANATTKLYTDLNKQ